jgi:hypothetical protein
MAANILSVANVAGVNNVIFTSAVTMGFPVDKILVQVIPSTVVGSTTCVTQITLIPTGAIYYTSTTAASIYTTSVYTGSAKFSFTSTIAAVNGNALASTQVTGFPSLGVLLEPITSTTFGSTACVTKITMLATNTVYFTADTVATLAALTA